MITATLHFITPNTLTATIGDAGCAGDPDQVLAWVMERLKPAADAEVVRYLPHGGQPQQDERVVPLRGHHGRHARLGVRG